VDGPAVYWRGWGCGCAGASGGGPGAAEEAGSGGAVVFLLMAENLA